MNTLDSHQFHRDQRTRRGRGGGRGRKKRLRRVKKRNLEVERSESRKRRRRMRKTTGRAGKCPPVVPVWTALVTVLPHWTQVGGWVWERAVRALEGKRRSWSS